MGKKRGTYNKSMLKRRGGSTSFFNTSKKTNNAREKGYRSNFELSVAKQLERQDIDPKECYEQNTIEYIIPETHHKYLVDFQLPNGIIIEAKGRWSPEDRKKILYIMESNPDLDIRMLFQNPNVKIYKGSSTTYGQWCTKKGIKWASKVIPKSWFEEEDSNGKKS